LRQSQSRSPPSRGLCLLKRSLIPDCQPALPPTPLPPTRCPIRSLSRAVRSRKRTGLRLRRFQPRRRLNRSKSGKREPMLRRLFSSPAPLTDSPEKVGLHQAAFRTTRLLPVPVGRSHRRKASPNHCVQGQGSLHGSKSMPRFNPPEMPDGTATPIDLRGAVRQERSDGRVSDSQHSSGYRQTEERNGNETGIQIQPALRRRKSFLQFQISRR